MKKELKFVSASIVGIVCASLMSPSFAASSVRSLGGAGTYTGTTSAAKATTSGSAVTAARAGSIRVDSGTRVNTGAALRTPSTRSATAPRLSIGKYLAGSTALKNNGKVDFDLSTNGTVTDIQGDITNIQGNITDLKDNMSVLTNDIDNLTVNVEQLQEDLQKINTDFEVSYEEGVLTITHGSEVPVEIPIFNPAEAEAALNKMIADQIADIEIPDAKEYTAGNLIEISDDNKVSAIVSALGSETNGLATTSDVTGYVTDYVGGYVEGYALPKPQAVCGYTTCVLSFKDGAPYWLELVETVNDNDDAGNVTTGVETETTEPTETTDSGDTGGM